MNILVINAGSSSLKYQLINMVTDEVMAKGVCERIGIDGSNLKHTTSTGKEFSTISAMKSHACAIKLVVDALVDAEHGVLSSMDEINAVGHRVVHGGEFFSGSTIITESVKKAIEACCELAPLHNPPNLIGINACEEIMPGIPQVAVFDTAFHQTMPAEAYMYALPYAYYEKYKIRKYGFHGTSHKYVAQKAAQMLGKDIKDLNIITCHLGNGSSIAAVKGGKSIDTSMGFTPLAGVTMGTRCGVIDPAIVPFIMEKENLTTKQIDNVMNKESGVLGVSGISSDFRDLEGKADEGNKRAQLAFNMFIYDVKQYVGAYAAVMGGVDAIVFTAGIGENNGRIRASVLEGFDFMGVKIDSEKNKGRGELNVSAADATVQTLVIPTNEELMIALDTQRLVEAK